MAYYHKPCDSYFVESHEDEEKRYAEQLRERDRRQKWQTQLEMAEELSQLTSSEYRDDVLQHMETMEVKPLKACYMDLCELTLLTRGKRCQMSRQSISRQRSNGSCVHTSLTS